MKPVNLFISSLCLLTIFSCGKSDSKGGGENVNPPSNRPSERPIGTESETEPLPVPTREEEREVEEERENQVTEGSYKSILRPLNHSLSGWIPNGMARIKILGDQFEINSWMDDSANVMHVQNIHLGNRCPTMADDLNQDGLLDFQETIQVTKNILIPLDSDLSSQAEGHLNYPKGNFSYTQKSSLSELLNDLRQSDPDPRDYFGKLPSSEEINLEGKVIIVLGISPKKELPETVSIFENLTPQLSIPISCGVIERVPEAIPSET